VRIENIKTLHSLILQGCAGFAAHFSVFLKKCAYIIYHCTKNINGDRRDYNCVCKIEKTVLTKSFARYMFVVSK